jgi:hypothetical protein
VLDFVAESKKDEEQATAYAYILVLRLHLHRFVTDDLVALYKSGYANVTISVLGRFVDPNHFTDRANEDFRAAGNLGWQSHRQVQLSARVERILDDKIDAPRRDVSGLPVTRVPF